MKRLLLAALRRAIADAVHAWRVRRVVASLDGCEFCGEPGVYFVDLTPKARHITARLVCTPCAGETLHNGGALLRDNAGRAVTHDGR